MNFIFCNVCCIYNMLYSIIYIYVCACVRKFRETENIWKSLVGKGPAGKFYPLYALSIRPRVE